MSIANQLALFLDIVQQGSFTKAAALHDMDNSSLSKQIKKLEADLGVQLLNRSTRSFSLTSAGEEILAQAQTVVNTLDQIQDTAAAYHAQPKGALRITTSVSLGQEVVQPVINRFITRYPDIKVTLFLDDKKTDIIADHFDLAFRLGKMVESNLIATKIANTNFAIVAAQQFIDSYGEPKTPQELIALPAVIYSNGDVTLDQIDIGTSEPLGRYRMQGNCKVNDVRAIINAVKSGVGYTVLDLSNLDRPISELGLVPLLTDHQLSNQGTGIYAVYPHRKKSALVAEFLEAMKSYVGNPPYWEQYIPNYHELYNGNPRQ
ncbi:LysR family transcriptional regulator [Ferrimonas lipolytica]|uniref:LysR family transcriptional regulator n=1 Tax=Ferrimonas lipolytica TaxID=2724191 RepID=A0A6H1UG83_9GAMM|nr:LysR family transcriptional regulator [Ferrimonas lipolytica]QIZ77639.1 LysR family transcriptional regulator [Ferrimonas lipolytica]